MKKRAKQLAMLGLTVTMIVWYTDDSICIRFRRRSTSCY